jgi:hypothetical protein
MELIMIDFNKARITETVNNAHFVVPRLKEDGITPATGQRIKPGMLVSCEVKQSNWGNVRWERRFAGVVLNVIDANSVTVRPLAGAPGNMAVMRLTEYQYYRYDQEGIEIPRSVVCTRRSLTILNPKRYDTESSFWTVVNAFAANTTNRRLRNYKAKLYAKLAERETERRILAGQIGRHYTADASTLWQYKRPSAKAQRKEMAAVVARGLKRIQSAIAGERELRTVLFATSMQRTRTVEIWNRLHPEQQITRTDGCSHLSLHGQMVRINRGRYDGSAYYCPHCAAEKQATGEFVELLDQYGHSQLYARGNYTVYEWDDGTKRVNPPPPVIGSYHSSKEKCGALPNLDGTPFSGLTLGLELEMEISPRVAESMDREQVARKLHNRIKAARPAAWGVTDPGYAFLENDGSISNGFEMVSSWGSLEVHRDQVLKIFGPDNHDSDVHPFEGLLRSNDAESSCGLHVHLAKPESISHAAKMQSFYHDPANRKLIRAIARRYAVHYAKVCSGMEKDKAQGNAKNALRGTVGDLKQFNRRGNVSRRDKMQYISRAISRLSHGDRYQQVNYCNSATVEIRVFKGSMLPTTIIACLEFSQAVWKFSRDVVAADLTIAKFMEYVNLPSNRNETKWLRGYLAQRGFVVYQPNPHKDARPYVTELNAEEA